MNICIILNINVKYKIGEVIVNGKYFDFYVQIGLNVCHYRKLKGLTQEQLADKISYSKNHIQQIETAKATPSVAVLIDISKALDIKFEKLFEQF